MATISTTKLKTSFGQINVAQSGLKDSSNPALLLIHGNSFCLKIWRHILSSPTLSKDRRIIAFDLPGHGDSSNAVDPPTQYITRGYARCAVEILEQLAVKHVVVLGWSLGGHVGIEMTAVLQEKKGCGVELVGLMIVGSPPIGYGEVKDGFTLGDGEVRDSAPARDELTEEEMSFFAQICADPPYEDWMLDAVRRTHGIARKTMFEDVISGKGVLDQRKAVREMEFPLAVVNGKDEPFVNIKFVREVQYGPRLFTGKTIELDGLKHAPFWAKPNIFEELLRRFLQDCDKYALRNEA